MKSPVVILSLFLLASFSIVVVSRVNKLQKKGKPTRFENRIDRTIPATTVEWTDTVQNLGKVIEGTMVNVRFTFKNTGSRMLIVSDVAASCGCTIAEKPQKPFSPGEIGTINATFDSKNRGGMNHKMLTVLLNTERRLQDLKFDVEVIVAK